MPSSTKNNIRITFPAPGPPLLSSSVAYFVCYVALLGLSSFYSTPRGWFSLSTSSSSKLELQSTLERSVYPMHHASMVRCVATGTTILNTCFLQYNSKSSSRGIPSFSKACFTNSIAILWHCSCFSVDLHLGNDLRVARAMSSAQLRNSSSPGHKSNELFSNAVSA